MRRIADRDSCRIPKDRNGIRNICRLAAVSSAEKRSAPVLLHDGKPKANQGEHVTVIDIIDTGTKDLQQCADAIIRLRAEHLYSRKDFTAIHFNFTNEDKVSFTRWVSGYRPIVKGRRVTWAKQANKDISYSNFRQYLRTVFVYVGSHSLSRELKVRKGASYMQIGDVFIKDDFPAMLLSFETCRERLHWREGFPSGSQLHACAGCPHHEKPN